jgi:ferredoxin like protein
MTESVEKLTLDKRLATLSFNKDPEPFITVDTETCFKCEKKPCLYICPANVYVWQDKLVYNTEGCMETGACLIVCHKLGAKAIHWKYPSGGHGATFTQG